MESKRNTSSSPGVLATSAAIGCGLAALLISSTEIAAARQIDHGPKLPPGAWSRIKAIDIAPLPGAPANGAFLDGNGDGIHTRTYRVYRSARCDPAKSGGVPCPLVIALHPANHTGFGFVNGDAYRGMSWTEAADIYRLVVAAPNAEFENNGFPSWSNGLFMGEQRIATVDEVGFLSQMVAKIAADGFAHIAPDTDGVWLHGGSAGGFLVHSLAGVFNSQFAYRIRGIATSVATYGGHTESPFYNDPDVAEHNVEDRTLCFQSVWKKPFDLLNPLPAYPIPALVMMGKYDVKVPDEGGSNNGCFGVKEDRYIPAGCRADRALRYTRDLDENAQHYAGALGEALPPGFDSDCSGQPVIEEDSALKRVVTYGRDAAGVPYGGFDSAGRPSRCKAVVRSVLHSCGTLDCPTQERWIHHSFPATTAQVQVWNTAQRIVSFWREFAGLP